MQLAMIVGHATSTVKHRSLAGSKLLICRVLGADGRHTGDPVLAVDQLGAGRGDRVIISSDGEGVRELLADETTPVRWWTIGIVDG